MGEALPSLCSSGPRSSTSAATTPRPATGPGSAAQASAASRRRSARRYALRPLRRRRAARRLRRRRARRRAERGGHRERVLPARAAGALRPAARGRAATSRPPTPASWRRRAAPSLLPQVALTPSGSWRSVDAPPRRPAALARDGRAGPDPRRRPTPRRADSRACSSRSRARPPDRERMIAARPASCRPRSPSAVAGPRDLPRVPAAPGGRGRGALSPPRGTPGLRSRPSGVRPRRRRRWPRGRWTWRRPRSTPRCGWDTSGACRRGSSSGSRRRRPWRSSCRPPAGRRSATLADLDGKTVGIPAPGTPEAEALAALLTQARVRPSGSRLASYGERGLAQALGAGEVVAGVIGEPWATRLVRDGSAAPLVDLRQPAEAARRLGGDTVHAAVFLPAASGCRRRASTRSRGPCSGRRGAVRTAPPDALAAGLGASVTGEGDDFALRVAGARGVFMPDGVVTPEALEASLELLQGRARAPRGGDAFRGASSGSSSSSRYAGLRARSAAEAEPGSRAPSGRGAGGWSPRAAPPRS